MQPRRGSHGQRALDRASGPAPRGGEHVVDIALHVSTEANRASGGNVRLVPKNSIDAVAVFVRAVEQGPDELLGGVDLGALGVAGGHRSQRAERAPLQLRGWRRAVRGGPARSPARRAADEYPAVALMARQVPRACGRLPVEVLQLDVLVPQRDSGAGTRCPAPGRLPAGPARALRPAAWPTRAPNASWKLIRAVMVGVGRCSPVDSRPRDAFTICTTRLA